MILILKNNQYTRTLKSLRLKKANTTKLKISDDVNCFFDIKVVIIFMWTPERQTVN